MRYMVKSHRSCNFPTQYQIEVAIELCGYEKYFPEKIFRDLFYIYCYYIFDEDPIYEPVPEHKKDFYEEMLELYRGLKLDYYRGTSPMEKAIYTLQDLSRVVDFRKLEQEEYEESDENFKKQLTSVDRELCGDIDEETVSKITSVCVDILTQIPMDQGTQASEISTTMENYSDVFTAKKSVLVRPDFKHKFANKTLDVNIVSSEQGDEEVLIYLEDVSSSMVEGGGYIASKAVQMALLNIDRPVHYYHYYGSKLELQVLESKEDKIKAFTSPCKYYDISNYYKPLFTQVINEYKKGHVLVSTDGKDHVPIMNTSLTFHCVTNVHSSLMMQFVKYTGGKYLML